jgi:hypothetical protein
MPTAYGAEFRQEVSDAARKRVAPVAQRPDESTGFSA